jgi:hypothetical protein
MRSVVMNMRCITNNPMIIDKGYPDTVIISGETLQVLVAVKEEILKGYKLVSHPLTSSIRPDMSPYKTVLLQVDKSVVDTESLSIINSAIEYTESLVNNQIRAYNWDEESLKDFQYIDYDIIQNLMY